MIELDIWKSKDDHEIVGWWRNVNRAAFPSRDMIDERERLVISAGGQIITSPGRGAIKCIRFMRNEDATAFLLRWS